VAPTEAATPPQTRPEDAPLTDSQIAGIASRIDLAEIDAGKLALAKGKSPTVRRFAQHIISDHRQVQSKLGALVKTQGIPYEDSAICDTLTRDTVGERDGLTGQPRLHFDRAYLKTQLKDHRDELQLLDTKLLPEVEGPDLRALLQATRAKVIQHIQMAEDAIAVLPPE
jgi:putative membrane protein